MCDFTLGGEMDETIEIDEEELNDIMKNIIYTQ